MSQNHKYYLVLLLMGATWGITPVFMKTAVSTGFQPFGIVFWSSVISAILSGSVMLIRNKRLALTKSHLGLYVGIALIGGIFPNVASYTGAAHLPAGIMALIVALVPMFAMPIALALGFETASLKRFIGAGLGLVAILLIVGPDASLPDSTKIGFVFIAILAPIFYGGEGNFLIWYGDQGMDSVQILFGASIIGMAISAPLTLATGQYIDPFVVWTLPHYAILATAVISWGTYATYLWLVGKTGPVFAAQVAYTVTGFGVIWSMLILGERYSIWVWAAFALILIGMLLIQPRNNEG